MTRGAFSKINEFFSLMEKRMLGKLLRIQNYSGAYDESYHKQYWGRVADFWEGTPIPVRPSKSTLEIYRGFLQKNAEQGEEKCILILGSTPELRDLAFEENPAKIYVADFSEQMPRAMLRFTKHTDPQKEIWVKANWLDLPFPEQFFDVILGDLVLQQFPPEKEQNFLQKISAHLKADGVFISRFQFLDKSYYHEGNLADVIKKTLDGTSANRQAIRLLKLRILWSYADLKKRTLNRHIAINGLTEYIKSNNPGNSCLREVLKVLQSEKDSLRNWSPPEEKELTDMLSRHFTISEMKIASDCEDARYFPVILLSKVT